MAEQRLIEEEGTRETQSRIKRRGILAAAGAVVAGIVAKVAADATPVEAANGDVIHVGDVLTGTFAMGLNITNNSPPPFGCLFVGNTGQADCIYGQIGSGSTAGTAGVRGAIPSGSNGTGVIGTFGLPNASGPPVSNANGVYGYVSAAGTAGVRGAIDAMSQGSGVIGTFGPSAPSAINGNGVYGFAGTPGLNGVLGIGNGNSASAGINGKSDIGYGGFFEGGGFSALYAASTGGPGAGGHGVYGFAQNTNAGHITAGVVGDSNTTYGIIGRTTASGYSGLTAITSTPGVAAMGATSTVPNAYAAFFTGTTVVNGNFVATGGSKSAAVPLNGGHSLVYCVESPESWFEDFGEAKLVNGKADVKLDPDFAAIVHTNAYHIFLTPRGDFNAHVTQQTASSFTIQQTTGTGSAGASGLFSYRIVAKRKDIEGERLAKFVMPKINHPDEAKMPQHPESGRKKP